MYSKLVSPNGCAPPCNLAVVIRSATHVSTFFPLTFKKTFGKKMVMDSNTQSSPVSFKSHLIKCQVRGSPLKLRAWELDYGFHMYPNTVYRVLQVGCQSQNANAELSGSPPQYMHT